MIKEGEKIKMENSIGSRLRRAWNAFVNNRDPTRQYYDYGIGSWYRQDRQRYSTGKERTIINAIYNRIAMDAAAVDVKHVQLDDDGRYESDINDGLNQCLNIEANLDQTGRAFRQDVFMSMLDEGVIAVAAVETTADPRLTESYDVLQLRTGKVVEWFPQHVRVRVYNERTGKGEEITLLKRNVALIENPFYAVMNETNSTLQRLLRKLALLDAVDEQASSGKLDLIIQLPYVVKGEIKQKQAEVRRQSIENQLAGSKYGIAYIDGTEHITQLNRPVENNLLKNVEYLTSMLYGQLGITPGIMDSSADEQTMLNYNNRIIEPLLTAFVDELKRKYLSKTARTRGQSVMFFRDPLRLVPASQMAELGDKLTRNEIVTSNEIRQSMGMKPSKDPKADQLRNSNLNHPDEKEQTEKPVNEEETTE